MELKGCSSVLLLLGALVGAVFISGCLDSGDDGDLDVAAVSILPQKEMVEAIAGGGIRVIVMVPAGQDPHGYTLTPGQLIDLVDADIYFKMGSGVEFEEVNMGKLKETNPQMEVVDTSEGITIKSYDEHSGSNIHEEDEEEEDQNHDHDHEGTDPHVWLSPSNMKAMAKNVLDALLEADPENEGSYRENYDSYVEEVDLTIDYIEDRLGPYDSEEFLAYHPSWGYFADEFHLVQLSVEDEGKQPGPQGIASIIEQAKEHNITVVFISPQFDSSGARQIADEIGGRVVKVDPLAEDYLENLRDVADKMESGFS